MAVALLSAKTMCVGKVWNKLKFETTWEALAVCGMGNKPAPVCSSLEINMLLIGQSTAFCFILFVPGS